MDNTHTQIIKQILDAYLSGSLSEPLSAKVHDWIADERHIREKYHALEELFNEKVQYDINPDEHTEREWEEICRRLKIEITPQQQQPIVRRMTLRRRISIVAASIIIPALLITGAYVYLDNSTNPGVEPQAIMLSISADKESSKAVILPDGSSAKLSAGSTLEYPLRFEQERNVRLRGEASFDVVKHTDSPFVVTADNIAVTVYGTEFMVTDMPDVRSVVTLKSGSVGVKTNAGNNETQLEPGDRLYYYCESKETIVVEVSQTDMGTQSLDFYMTPLSDIFKTLCVQYGLTIDQTESKYDKRYTIKFFPEQNISDVMQILQSLAPEFNYTINGNHIEIR